ncbi:MAG: hypothetical protein GY856_47155 [bacterium]|nr:hypothetical protein [bacterium]
MPSTYSAILRGDHLEWMGSVPQEARKYEPLKVRVTIVSAVEAEAPSLPSDPEDEIGRLYDEIAALAARCNGSGTDAELEASLEAAWTRLRELQAKEAERFRHDFEASLAMPLDAGARILDEARALRRELEDPSSTD